MEKKEREKRRKRETVRLTDRKSAGKEGKEKEERVRVKQKGI